MIFKIDAIIGTFRQIDEFLMGVFSYSLFYPALEDRPQTRLAVLATLIPLELVIVALLVSNDLLLLLTFPLWVNAFYEWRLWHRMRR